jgi:heparanase 1
MQSERTVQLGLVLAVSIGWVLGGLCWSASSLAASSMVLAPATMARLGSIDERFQSYNIEMVEVTGGHFWRPYGDSRKASSSSASGGVPKDPPMFAYRKPIDLTNPRLRMLAAALGPAYVRVSGTWANTTYFDDAGGNATPPPAGFNGVLTREQWKSVVAFARAVDARLVTSFAISPGTRDARGVWTPTEASKLIAYTRSLGGSIAAAEFMNEPSLPAMGGAPGGYDAASYGRDIAVFRPFLKRASPDTIFLGPGSVREGVPGGLRSEDLLKAAGPAFDAFSYHYYGANSQRCTKEVPSAATRDANALSELWLSGAERAESFYADLRNRFEPGRPLWITETAAAACGGNPWDPTFLDSFRYLDQLGRMAKRQVQVVIHNTLAASDYGLLDENSFAPRPNYWAALLWRKLMGTIVLDPGSSPRPGLHLYAHCLRGKQGGVALLAINTDRTISQSLDLPVAASRYTVTAVNLTDTTVRLNGRELRLGTLDGLPALEGDPVAPGHLDLAAASITFLAIAEAGNPACL